MLNVKEFTFRFFGWDTANTLRATSRMFSRSSLKLRQFISSIWSSCSRCPHILWQVLNEDTDTNLRWFNLFATRTRRLSIFQQPPIFNMATQNLWLFPAILFALVVIFIFLYIPGLNTAINSSKIPVEYFFFPTAFGLWVLFADEVRKWWVRKYPKGRVAWLAW